MVREYTMIMQHWDNWVCESVDGTFQVIGCRQWVESVRGKCNMMIKGRYMVERTGLVCVYIYVVLGETRSMSVGADRYGEHCGNGEWKSAR